MKPDTLRPELLRHMDVYWRAANDLPIDRIYPITNGAVLPFLYLIGLPDCDKSSTALSGMNLPVRQSV